MPSTFAFGRKYSARIHKRAHEDLSDSVTSLQYSSSSNTSSQTPPTSPTDTPRESADRVVPQIPKRRVSERSRPSIPSYNTEILSGTARRSRKSLLNEDRNLAHEGPDGDVDPSKQLMLEAERALGLECQDSALSGDEASESSSSSLTEVEKEDQEEDEVDKLPRRSARLDTNGTAAAAVRLSNAAPENRRWITTGSGLEKSQDQEKEEEKKVSIRGRGTEVVSPATENHIAQLVRPMEEPLAKAVAKLSEKEQPTARRAKKKVWLTQGLYVGQDVDPRLEKVFGKRSCSYPQQRNLLPLPMFAGARMLELGRDFKLPFDVFNALPRGQPKPEDWKKTHKNIFIGDAVNIWKKTKPSEDSTCVCTRDSACGDTCFNRSMFYECDDSNCKIGANYCTNRSFQELRQRSKHGNGYDIGVEVLKTTDRGYGVRAMRCFEPNQIIVEYTGEIITQDECDNRMNTVYKNNKCYYLMQFDQQMILDATRGSIARFVNHSCEPNCAMIKWTVAEKPRVALFAGDRGIMTGEELTYDYNFNPYSVKNVERCRCGASSCRGFLGPKPKEAKDQPTGNKRSSQKTPEQAAEKASKKRETFDSTSAPKKNSITGTKRNFQKAFQDSVESVTKKRKINLPSAIKTGLATAKAQTEKQMRRVHFATATARRRILKPVRKPFSMSLRKKLGSGEGISTNTEFKRRPSSMSLRRDKEREHNIPTYTEFIKESSSVSLRGDEERENSVLSDKESNNNSFSMSLRRDEGREEAISINTGLNRTREPIIISTPLIPYASRRRHPASKEPEMSTNEKLNTVFEKVKRSTDPEPGNTMEDKLNLALEKIKKSAGKPRRKSTAMITYTSSRHQPLADALQSTARLTNPTTATISKTAEKAVSPGITKTIDTAKQTGVKTYLSSRRTIGDSPVWENSNSKDNNERAVMESPTKAPRPLLAFAMKQNEVRTTRRSTRGTDIRGPIRPERSVRFIDEVNFDPWG